MFIIDFVSNVVGIKNLTTSTEDAIKLNDFKFKKLKLCFYVDRINDGLELLNFVDKDEINDDEKKNKELQVIQNKSLKDEFSRMEEEQREKCRLTCTWIYNII